MEKRLILMMVLTMLIMGAWQLWFAPETPEQPAGVAAPATTGEVVPPEVEPYGDRSTDRAVAEGGEDESGDAGEVAGDAGELVQAEREEEFPFENDIFRVILTNRGGRVRSWQLKEYVGMDGESVDLVPCLNGEDVPLPLALDFDDSFLSDTVNDALFEVDTQPVYADGSFASGTKLVFTWADGRGLEVVKSLTFREGDHLVEFETEVLDRGRRRPVRVAWGPGLEVPDGEPPKKRISAYINYAHQVVMNMGGTVIRKKAGKAQEGLGVGALQWAGLEDQYFTALLIPNAPQSQVRVWKRDMQFCPMPGEEGREPLSLPLVSVGVPEDGALVYAGPKQYQLQKSLGHELDRSVWFSSFTLLQVIAKYLFLTLVWIHDNLVANYGLAIILATVALRLVLFPLNQFAMVRMKKTQVEMQRVQPKINAIKKKYGKNKDAESRAKLNKETMAMYQKEGINPMGGMVGCLPLLAQFPILIAFYNMLTVAIELRGAPFFGWITDLSQQESPFPSMAILMGITMFLQQKMSQGKVTDPMQKQQQKIMMIMPFMFTYICFQMPSGMVLYWFVNNLLGIGQQWLVNRHAARTTGAPQKAKKA